MKIYLAGYNLDADLIEELKKSFPERKDITPETLSAAYARISRDPRPINELRRIARTEVEKARVSNEKIIFEMGHSSVAEHAVFNFDLIGVSRLAVEEIEKSRLASFTEKSQRYITLEQDFVLPEEIGASKYAEKFKTLLARQAACYGQLFEKLKKYTYEKNPELAKDPKNQRLLEGWAKEDARYVASLSTTAQLGMTLNARSLEHLLCRLAASSLNEVRQIGESIYNLVRGLSPSIVKYVTASVYDKAKYDNLRRETKKYLPEGDHSAQAAASLIDYTAEADNKLIAVLLYVSGQADYTACWSAAAKLSKTEKLKIVQSLNQDLKLYNSVAREYEFPDLTYGLVISAANFGQLKRHRLATIVAQDYNPALGVTIPAAIIECGLEAEFKQIVAETEQLYSLLKPELPQAANYVLTNAHRRRVLLKINARELHHISRLREDAHAQWDIRHLAAELSRLAREVMPITCAFLGGKDRFAK